MRGRPLRTAAALFLAASFTMPATALELFGSHCLKKLTERTHVWSECQHKWNATDTRCLRLKMRMHESMQRCTTRGYTKADIDAAMLEGYRSAGTGVLTGPAAHGYGSKPRSPWAEVKRDGTSLEASAPSAGGAAARR